jgi:hypothetical protein
MFFNCRNFILHLQRLFIETLIINFIRYKKWKTQKNLPLGFRF